MLRGTGQEAGVFMELEGRLIKILRQKNGNFSLFIPAAYIGGGKKGRVTICSMMRIE